jgi:hypothetical protein
MVGVRVFPGAAPSWSLPRGAYAHPGVVLGGLPSPGASCAFGTHTGKCSAIIGVCQLAWMAISGPAGGATEHIEEHCQTDQHQHSRLEETWHGK